MLFSQIGDIRLSRTQQRQYDIATRSIVNTQATDENELVRHTYSWDETMPKQRVRQTARL